MAQPQTEIIDCTDDPQTSYTRTFPNNTWMSKITPLTVGLSTSDLMVVQVGSETSNYIRSFHSNTADGTDSQPHHFLSGFSGTVQSGHYTLIGATLATPTYFSGRPIDIGDTVVDVFSGYQTTVAAHSTFKITTVTGTTIMDAGKIYITHYIRNQQEIIEIVDFAVSPANSHVFDTKKNNALVLMCPGLVIASADQPLLEVGTGPSTFATGASDYEVGSANAGATAAETTSRLFISNSSNTANSFFAHIEGFGTTGPSCLINGGVNEIAFATPRHSTGLRLAGVKNTHLRMKTLGGNNFTAGKAYLIGAK